MNGDRDTKPSARAATGPARVGALAGPGKGTLVAMAQGVGKGTGDLAAAKARLDGLESLYARYKLHRAVPQAFRVPAGTSALHGVEDKLEVELPGHGFSGVAEFAAYVEQFEAAFEQAAARVTLDLLARYASKLEQERRRTILQQDRELLIKLGTNDAFQMVGTYGGRTYTLGITKGSVRQLYPN